jgi:phenylacetate-CoA ligase
MTTLTTSPFFDSLETRPAAKREAALLAALPAQVAHAQTHSAAFAQILRGVDPTTITTRAALAQLPVTRKNELQAMQESARQSGSAADVFGGFNAVGFGAAMPRVFASPGPIYEPEGTARDYWRMARSIYAAGFRAGELVHNCFSYHFTPAGSMKRGRTPLAAPCLQAVRGKPNSRFMRCVICSPLVILARPAF